ncbi:DinB family protein [Silvibacterium dinghuense]|uniref:DinB family protein n=1 Tax=Silvibacterium dinghuense TaxID=1560006 RepID=A0A4Q1SDE3_9BACT|nr:DinB family protein [Silvibacterium dinghuense]RXS95085.1 DinB family protein [Silvibacterium dinghuense]GGH10440.1 hypothetical protein GCM10011586_28800 [Silvibacterium dinghuense]
MSVTKPATQPEPWLRGTRTELSAVLRGVLHALDLAREDVLRACAGLSMDELYAMPLGLTPLAYHLRHIPRSLDRLLTYAEGETLSQAQLTKLSSESEPDVESEELITEFVEGLDQAEARIRRFVSADLEATRSVGRKELPTTVGGLLVHLADHTQRHVGQVVTTAKAVRASAV